MRGTSVRKVEGLSQAEKVAALRSRMAELGGEVPERVLDATDVLSVGEGLGRVLPMRGLPRRSVTHMSETPSLVVELLEQATRQGSYAGVVGWPELSYAGINNLHHVVAVPDPGMDPLSVLTVLVEGLDLVVYRGAAAQLSPTRARPLLGKLRAGHAALLLVGTQVQSPTLTVEAEVTAFRGIGQGSGRITGMDIAIRAEAKGYRPGRGTVALGAAPQRRLKAVP
ncbi:hypothetical protein QP027_01880 [Corynebacterium breve]|uniref:Uncharacterized protein n=1 Tax=Corynebacterium breve TaxID=3049799 RepID=A0ABY8VF90_9CORY|nr:hypothetical protein [Corynebacterium breve]WIM68173.1 hypothetical protein QP027_01880 [Corynebacterium breve]